MSRVLLLGRDGQVGWELWRRFGSAGDLVALGHMDLDLTDTDSLRRIVREHAPDIVVNAAAYTDVDKAETEPELAEAVNARAPRVVAEEARRQGSLFIHLSTDYVFDGLKPEAYTEDDPPRPINQYGRTKLEGERGIEAVGGNSWIFRTSWVYSRRRPSFLSHVLDWSRSQTVVRVVDDQFGSPTWCRSLAEGITRAVALVGLRGREWAGERSGVYHVACQGTASRYELAQKILDLDPSASEQTLTQLIPARSEEFPGLAARPRNSSLNCQKFQRSFDIVLPEWEAALEGAMQQPMHEE